MQRVTAAVARRHRCRLNRNVVTAVVTASVPLCLTRCDRTISPRAVYGQGVGGTVRSCAICILGPVHCAEGGTPGEVGDGPPSVTPSGGIHHTVFLLCPRCRPKSVKFAGLGLSVTNANLAAC